MADSHDPNDPDQRHTDDPELEKIKEDTAKIFVQFVRLHSHSASSNAVPADRTSPDSSTEPTTVPSPPSLQQCLQVQESPRNAARGPSTLPRQKSREATRKDPHPKAVHSTRQPTAQIVPNSHCSVEATPVSPKSRPDKLCLMPKHKRVPSSHSATGSDSSGKTTPAAQDPPMELMSPELSSSYPPMSSAPSDLREGLVRSAEHASIAAASANCATSQEREHHYASADKGGDPCAVQARKIADRLKNIGDDLEEEYIKSKLNDLTEALGDVVVNASWQSMFRLYTYSNLSWRKVAEIFKLLCRVMETTCYDDQLSLSVFEKVWYSLLDSVVPWIQNRGGWAALQRETEPQHVNTPNAPRRSHPLNPAQSEPVLLHNHSPTTTRPLCQPLFVNGAATLGRASEAGRIMYTPQMPRHRHAPPSREQSSPCLPRDRSNSQHSQHSQAESALERSRLWSLTESGSFKREEDGIEDIEHSISELDMTVNDDEGEESEAFLGSQEEAEGEEGEIEEESQQEAEKTLTASSFHASASFSNSSTSPPIIVPSSNSNSQPDAMSMDEFPIDSGIDISSLSLSCSPRDRGVSFIVGGGSNRPSSSIPRLNQTSLTSLSSVASASPVHTSPSSRKNSANGSGSSYFSDKTRPRSGGSLKESRPRHSGGDSPHYRTGSLRSSRSRPRYHQMTTPTNETSSQSAASGGHSSWMETPVRRMSTSAAVIYELVKDVFRSS